jgi:DNA-binding Lrp family transcriptional regulator
MVVESLRLIPQITVIDFTTGQFSVFCKVRAIDSLAARDVLKNVHSIEGIRRIETFISMEELLNDRDSLMDSMEM